MKVLSSGGGLHRLAAAPYPERQSKPDDHVLVLICLVESDEGEALARRGLATGRSPTAGIQQTRHGKSAYATDLRPRRGRIAQLSVSICVRVRVPVALSPPRTRLGPDPFRVFKPRPRRARSPLPQRERTAALAAP